MFANLVFAVMHNSKHINECPKAAGSPRRGRPAGVAALSAPPRLRYAGPRNLSYKLISRAAAVAQVSKPADGPKARPEARFRTQSETDLKVCVTKEAARNLDYKYKCTCFPDQYHSHEQ
ncbi:MAG: hypothetical protein LBI02_10060 [Opitutaceae bacterium]|nr:hypothetical protein [Opitutaceae bacterium]